MSKVISDNMLNNAGYEGEAGDMTVVRELVLEKRGYG